MSASFDFGGQSVLVTGASRGIGYAVARAFALAGASVAIIADDAAVEQAARTIGEEAGRKVRAQTCDIADEEAVRRALDGIGTLDILVNNAGVELPTPVGEMHTAVDDAFRRIIDVNVLGTWWVTRAAVPKMGPGGRILITSSIWGRTAVPGFAGYAASKHALIGIARSLSRELGPKGMRVNAVCPGWVKTEASLRSLDDVAGMYLYLASEAAANVTGQAIPVDRGEVMA